MKVAASTLEALRSARAAGDDVLSSREGLLDDAVRLLPSLEDAADLDLPARRLAPVGSEVEATFGVAGRGRFAGALVAELALRRAARLEHENLPPSVLELYPETLRRIAAYLASADLSNYWIGDDPFLKDLRIAAGYTVPGGAQDIDLAGRISRKSGLKAIVTSGAVRAGWTVMVTGGPGWLSIHTDSRYLDEFDADGRDRLYLRVADLLELTPEASGMVGTSWFYDPALLGISPRLAYLQQRPTENGAFLLRHGPGSIHTERATRTSPTRRKLYEEGAYVPVCYSVVWPRERLIEWARRTRRECR